MCVTETIDRLPVIPWLDLPWDRCQTPKLWTAARSYVPEVVPLRGRLRRSNNGKTADVDPTSMESRRTETVFVENCWGVEGGSDRRVVL